MARNETEVPSSEDIGKPYEYDPNFKGPLHRRSCTDIICLLIFIVFIFCWMFVAIFAFVKGNPETLTLPRDSNGSRCGYDAHVKDKKYLLFFDLTKCISSTVAFTGCSTTQICVKECPNKSIFKPKPSEYEEYAKYCVPGTVFQTETELQKMIDSDKCPPWILASTNVFNRCLYNVYDKKGSIITYKANNRLNTINVDELKLIENFLQRANTWVSFVVHYVIGIFTDNQNAHKVGNDIVEDIKAAWKEILGCVIGGILISIIYIAVMRWIAGIMVWISLIGSLALLGFCVYYTSERYVYYKDHPTEHEFAKNYLQSIIKTQEFWLTLLIICSIVLIILLLILLVLRKRIRLAIALIEEGSKAVSAATSTLFFPIVPWILQILILAFFITTALYLSTTGSPLYKIKDFKDCICSKPAENYADGSECDPDTFANYCKQSTFTSRIFTPCSTATCSFVKMNNPMYVPYFHVVNVFGLFWLVFFASAFGEMVLASTFATWYWTKPKSKVPFFTLTAAVLRTIRYHLGTLAFGSLLVAICRMIRVLLEYIDSKLKKYDNEITKAILCCLKCCFYCLEKFIKFINRNAYIMCAIHGKNFCSSAKDAFNLLLRNILRTFVLDKVVDFLFFLSKLLIAIGIGCITYTILEYVSETKITYTFVPAIFVGICIYLLTIVFFNVYTMAVDTLFLCYLEDSERNDGSQQKPYFMSSNLRKIFGHKNKTS